MDGDTSTNDTVIGLASGAAGNALIRDPASAEAHQLEAAVTALLQARPLGACRLLRHCLSMRWTPDTLGHNLFPWKAPVCCSLWQYIGVRDAAGDAPCKAEQQQGMARPKTW